MNVIRQTALPLAGPGSSIASVRRMVSRRVPPSAVSIVTVRSSLPACRERSRKKTLSSSERSG